MQVRPMMFRYIKPDKYQLLVAKMDPAKVKEVNTFMESKWKEVFPLAQYNGRMMDEEMHESNEINANVVTMFGFLGFFGALMTGIGLYTLVSLNIVKRMKEIGVRKVLGASLGNIAGVINKEFVINMLFSMVVGGALGYGLTFWLMQSIWAYYLAINAVTIIISVTAMVFIAISAVGYKTVATASLNPTKTLRDE
jgi:ABC-type antimicrobial peptide transport system permease subunit